MRDIKKMQKSVQIDHVINHMFLANHNKIQIILCNLYIFNITQCNCKIQPHKWLIVIFIYNLLSYFDLKRVVEVTYNYMFSFYQNPFVL